MDPDTLIELTGVANYAAAASQLDRLTRSLYEIEQNNLIGVYLHGSLAMRCFNPASSDLDILVLLAGAPAADHRRRWAEALLHVSGAPAPIEISFLHRSQYTPWLYPTPYDFHFSEGWRERVEGQLLAGDESAWAGATGADVDLAAHFTVARRRGVRLYGEAIEAAMPHVPWAHYCDSISRDIVWACERAADNPVYLVLNCCRVWATLAAGAAEQLVLSKAEGVAWALPRLPAAPAAVVAQAAAIYAGQAPQQTGGQGGATLNAASALETARWICVQMGLALEE